MTSNSSSTPFGIPCLDLRQKLKNYNFQSLVLFFCATLLFVGTTVAAEPVNINTATVDELEKVKFLSLERAQNIVAYRNEHGPFGSVDQLDDVPKFGPYTINKIRDFVTVGDDGAAAPTPERLPGVFDTSVPVNINTATAAELDKLPQISPATAQNIVEHREKHGYFGAIEHLDDVPGIGPGIIDKIRSLVTVGDEGLTVDTRPRLLDVNTATAADFEKLKGIGDSKAIIIVEYRDAHGSFQSVDEFMDLLKVSSKSLGHIRDRITVNESTRGSRKLPPSALPSIASQAREANPTRNDSPPVDLNTATLEELKTVFSQGGAEKIIARRKLRPYKSPWELSEYLPYSYVNQVITNGLVTVGAEENFRFGALIESKLGVIAAFILAIVIAALLWFRRVFGNLAERILSLVRLRPRLAIVALLVSMLSSAIVWYALEKVLISDLERRFEKDRAEARRAVSVAWASFEEPLGGSFKAAESVDAESEAFSSQRPDSLGITLVSSQIAAAWDDGLDAVVLDRRETDPVWFFSPGLAHADQEAIKPWISKTFAGEKESNSKYAARTVLVRRSPSFTIDLSASDGGFVLCGSTRTLVNFGNSIRLLRVTPTALDHIRHLSGHDVVLQARTDSTTRYLASSRFGGRPVLSSPFLSLWDILFLARKLPGASSINEFEMRKLARNTAFPYRVSVSIGTVRDRILSSAKYWGELYGHEPTVLDAIVMYSGHEMPLPLSRDRFAHPRWDPILNRLRTGTGDDTAPKPGVKQPFASKLLIALPQGIQENPALLTQRINNFDVINLREVLEELYDWRPSMSLSPVNLRTADDQVIRNLITNLALPNPDAIIVSLKRFMGPDGEPYSSSKLADLNPEESQLLASFLFQHDPESWNDVRAAEAVPLQEGQTIITNGTEFIATSAGEVGDGVELIALVDRTSFLAEAASLRLTGYGAVGVVFILSFIGFQVVAVSLVGPIGRIERAMLDVTSGNLTATLPTSGRDEFAEISRRFNTMVVGLAERVRLESSFRRYVPDSIVREAAKTGEVARLGGELATCSIFFADVRGFTKASQLLSPRDVVDLLNSYFVYFVEEIEASGGTIDKFIGDAVLAVWGAPEPSGDHAARAVDAAIRIQEKILAANRAREAQNLPVMYFGIGISTGEVLAGHVGADTRADWTVIGSVVNLASRISSVAWAYRVLVSEKTRDLLHEAKQYKFRACEPLRLKGFDKPVTPYTVLWHDGHSGPMLAQNTAGEWYARSGDGSVGPFTLEQLVRIKDFSGETLVSRSGSDWVPWRKAARPFRVWLIQTENGPKGTFTFDEILAFPGNTAETLVRMQGDERWMELRIFEQT